MLDIIVTHYNEPWDVGKKFFYMLDLQRDVDFSQIKVTLVNDGHENKLPDKLFSHRSYQVEQISIDHNGVSAARNAGIEHSTAEWLCFCDFDDMFADVYALRNILNVLPADNFDILWADIYAENKGWDGKTRLFTRGENLVFIHGKFYRRQFLITNGLRFDTALIFNEDSAFNSIANTIVDYHRTGKIETPAPIYIWTYRENSATTSPENRPKALIGLYERNKRVCKAFRLRLPYKRYCAMIARTVMDTYYALNVPSLPNELKGMKEDFVAFYREHKDQYSAVDLKTLREIKEISRKEYQRGIEEEEARRDIDREQMIVDESVSVTKWLRSLEAETAPSSDVGDGNPALSPDMGDADSVAAEREA